MSGTLIAKVIPRRYPGIVRHPGRVQRVWKNKCGEKYESTYVD